MASSRLLERPEKILLIQGVEVPVDGGGERTKFIWPNVPGCVQTLQPGRLSKAEHFYKTGDQHHPKGEGIWDV